MCSESRWLRGTEFICSEMDDVPALARWNVNVQADWNACVNYLAQNY